MADTFTTDYGLTKPEVTASKDTWGRKHNVNFSDLDGLLLRMVGVISFKQASGEPAGWLKCNGQTVSRSTYDRLWQWVEEYGALAADEASKLPGEFGPGDESTTFSLPDLRGESLRVWDDAKGVDSGRVLGSFQAGQVETHTHIVDSDGAHAHTTQSGGAHDHTGSVNSAGAHSHAYGRPNPVAANERDTSARQAVTTDSTTSSAGTHSHTSISLSTTGAHTHTTTTDGAHTHTTDTAGDHNHTTQNTGGESRVRNLAVAAFIKT